ncbi:MAG: DUF348 domain-containing protein [Chloroflexi bacterium]|nr:DUF348 domain-containing protein [Chloroflexota bacterium]
MPSRYMNISATDYPARRLHIPRSLQAIGALICVLGTLAAGYRTTRTPVTLVVNGERQYLHTQQDSIAALLLDAGITLGDKDIVTPALDTPIEPGGQPVTVYVKRARPVRISTDGQSILMYTHATAPEAILTEAKVSLGPFDAMSVEGDLRALGPASIDPDQAPHIIVRRAVPLTVHDAGHTIEHFTTSATVGDALTELGLTIFLADYVEPALNTPVSAGMEISIDRSVPVQVAVDGRLLRTRTHRQVVGDVLGDLGIVLTGQDYTTPTLESPIGEDELVYVIRVTERFLIEQDPIAFESIWQSDPDLEIDNQRLLQEGAPGILQRRIRVRYENGDEVARAVENEYVAVPPTTKIMGYGTKIIIRTLDTPSGPVEYWRVLRMHATSYSAGTSGTSPSSPWYGRTATGLQMRFGIVAVDPRYINLHSEVYVPGYGVGYAGDTGGSIKGRRIDLGYDDSNLALWYRWVDVYLLTPVPSNVNYFLTQ